MLINFLKFKFGLPLLLLDRRFFCFIVCQILESCASIIPPRFARWMLPQSAQYAGCNLCTCICAQSNTYIIIIIIIISALLCVQFARLASYIVRKVVDAKISDALLVTRTQEHTKRPSKFHGTCLCSKRRNSPVPWQFAC